jgi:hypothetical protein
MVSLRRYLAGLEVPEAREVLAGREDVPREGLTSAEAAWLKGGARPLDLVGQGHGSASAVRKDYFGPGADKRRRGAQE